MTRPFVWCRAHHYPTRSKRSRGLTPQHESSARVTPSAEPQQDNRPQPPQSPPRRAEPMATRQRTRQARLRATAKPAASSPTRGHRSRGHSGEDLSALLFELSGDIDLAQRCASGELDAIKRASMVRWTKSQDQLLQVCRLRGRRLTTTPIRPVCPLDSVVRAIIRRQAAAWGAPQLLSCYSEWAWIESLFVGSGAPAARLPARSGNRGCTAPL